MPNIGPLEIAIVVFIIFLILGPRGIRRMGGRAGKRLKQTGDAALEAGQDAKQSFAQESTGEGTAAQVGRAARTAGEGAVDAGRGLRAGLTAEEGAELSDEGVGAKAQKLGERVRSAGDAVVEEGRGLRSGLTDGDPDPTDPKADGDAPPAA